MTDKKTIQPDLKKSAPAPTPKFTKPVGFVKPVLSGFGKNQKFPMPTLSRGVR